MKKVRGYKKEVTNEVEACYNNLMLKRNELQKVQNKLNNLIQNSHVAEKVKQRKGVTEELTKIELDKPAISKPQALCQTSKFYIINDFHSNYKLHGGAGKPKKELFF